MTENAGKIGAIAWTDLTVPNADEVRDFYKAVVGWGVTDVSMGDYSDYCMTVPGTENAVAGVCHARGVNADLPPQWLMYVQVADLDKSIANCRDKGGRVVAGPKSMGPTSRYCVVKDPAGAVVALIQTTEKQSG